MSIFLLRLVRKNEKSAGLVPVVNVKTKTMYTSKCFTAASIL